MTNEEITQLPPEELRLAIAKAKGWTILPMRIAPCWTGSSYIELPDWPADIAAAWGLVEEMTSREHVTLDSQGPTWTIDVDDYSRTIQVDAATAPLAICQAYLVWKADVK